jgi:FSR family fosmidomycin resistance protein-like MFS transporter
VINIRVFPTEETQSLFTTGDYSKTVNKVPPQQGLPSDTSKDGSCLPHAFGQHSFPLGRRGFLGDMRSLYSPWQLRILLAGCMAHITHDGFTDMLYVFFPVWQAQMVLTYAEVGLFKTLYSGALSLFQLPSGILGRRFGGHRILIAGTVMTSLAIASTGWATTPFALGLILILGGMGASVQHPLASTAIANAYHGRESRTALGTYNFSGDIGKLIFPGAAALLIVNCGWPVTVRLLSICGLFVSILLYFVFRGITEQPDGAPKTQPDRAFSLSRKWNDYHSFYFLSVIGIIDNTTRAGFLTFFPFLLQDKSAGMGTIGLALSLVFFGGAVGKFACGLLAGHFGVLRTVIVTEIMTALCIGCMIFVPLSGALFLAPILGVFLNGTSSALYGSVPELVPHEQRIHAFSVYYTVTLAAGSLAPFFYGLIGDISSVNTAVSMIALLVLLTIPLIWLLRGKFAQ